MSILQLNLGTYPNDGQGDDLRTAFQKTIDNFNYLDLVKIEDGGNLGTSQLDTHGIYAGKEDTTLLFKSIKQGDNVTITSDGNVITIRPKDSINSVEEDTTPRLGGDLDINGNNIVGEGNISIEGEVTADFFTGDVEGTVYGNVFGDLTGTVTGSLYGPVFGDVTSELVTSNLVVTPAISNQNFSRPLTIYSAQDIDILGLENISIISGSQMFGNGGQIVLLGGSGGGSTGIDEKGGAGGNVLIAGGTGGNDTEFGDGGTVLISGGLGLVPGDVFIEGGASTSSGHGLVFIDNIRFSTNGVLSTPTVGQSLVWNGSEWLPQTITSGVSRIIPGNNVTISPSNGTGEVTINATGGGSITEINTFDFGNFTNTFTNPITYLLNQVGVDFGSFAMPSQFTIDLGSF